MRSSNGAHKMKEKERDYYFRVSTHIHKYTYINIYDSNTCSKIKSKCYMHLVKTGREGFTELGCRQEPCGIVALWFIRWHMWSASSCLAQSSQDCWNSLSGENNQVVSCYVNEVTFGKPLLKSQEEGAIWEPRPQILTGSFWSLDSKTPSTGKAIWYKPLIHSAEK